MNPEKLKKLQAQQVVGGKNQPRRKVIKKPKSGSGISGDDRKLQTQLKKLNLQNMQGVEEVNMFRSDGDKILHFSNPKAVHAAANANTFAIYGTGKDKDVTELVPNIIPQLAPEAIANLQRLASSFGDMRAQGGATGFGAAPTKEADSDDDVPDLVDNFDVEDSNKESVKFEAVD